MSDRIDVSATVKVNDQATGPIGAMRGALQGLQNMARSVSQSFRNLGTMKGLGAAAKGVGSAFRQLGGTIMSIVKPIAALVGITGGIGVAEAIGGLQTYVDTAKELGRLAPSLGTTAEKLSELQYAAKRSGVGAESLNSALQTMNRQIGQASIGKLPALTSLMQKYGIQTLDPVTKKQRTANEMFGDFADVISRQKNPIMAARMAQAAFGRSLGPELLPMLMKGRKGIEDYIKAGHDAGLIFTQEQIKEAQEFAAAQSEVNLLWESLGRQFNQILLPAIKPLLLAFAEFLRDNKKAFEDFFKGIGDALKQIDWKATLDDIKEWGRWIKENIKYIGGWKGALIGFGLVLAGPLLTSLAIVIAALAKLALAVVLNPILGPIVAIAAAAYLIYKNWDKIGEQFWKDWESVKAAFRDFRDWLADWLPDISDERIKQLWTGLGSWFATKWAEIKAPFIEWGTWLAGFLPDLSDKRLREVWAGLGAWFGTKWAEVKAPFIEAGTWLAGWIPQFVWDGIKAAWSGITSFFDTIWKGVTKVFETAWGIIKPIVDALKAAIGWITDNLPSVSGATDAIKGVGRTVFEAPGKAADWVGEQWRNTFGAGAGPAPSIQQQAAAAPAIVQQAAAAPARVEGQVGVDIHMTGAPPGTTISTQERGQVRATGDVGQTMAVPA